tara:strand:+ start:10790 stop:11578 length:789 start_codon:yes stop_codon:yes gene_type:complete
MDKISCLWIQSELDDMSIECINTWLYLDYYVDLYTYSIDNFKNPWIEHPMFQEKVCVMDAREIYDVDLSINKRYEFVADRFRFEMFEQNQNVGTRIIWMDTDQMLLRTIKPICNFVSSQFTLQKGAFRHTKLKVIPNIGVMCFDGSESVDWTKIINKGEKTKAKEFQSGYLKYYEKEMLKYPDLISDPETYMPIHWAWCRDIYTRGTLDPTIQKYGLFQKSYTDIINDDQIIGVNMWRQIYKKNDWTIKSGSIYNKLFNYQN